MTLLCERSSLVLSHNAVSDFLDHFWALCIRDSKALPWWKPNFAIFLSLFCALCCKQTTWHGAVDVACLKALDSSSPICDCTVWFECWNLMLNPKEEMKPWKSAFLDNKAHCWVWVWSVCPWQTLSVKCHHPVKLITVTGFFCDSLCVDNRSAPCFHSRCISVKVMHPSNNPILLNYICNQCNWFNCLLWDCAQACCEATQICQSEVRLLFTNLELQDWSKQVIHLSDRPVDSLSVSSWLNTRLIQIPHNVGSSRCPKWSLKVCFILWKTYIPFFPFHN